MDFEFLDELKNEFDNATCISLVLNVASEDQPPKLILLNHPNDKEVTNRRISDELNTMGAPSENILKKVIKLLIK